MAKTRLLLLLALISGLACTTTSPPVENDPTETPAASFIFVPADSSSTLQLAEGRYPDLFSSASYALWVGAAPQKLDVLEVDDSGNVLPTPQAPESGPSPSAPSPSAPDALVFECHLKSSFADMSIAYDVVGLRGMSVYLETPAGTRLSPLQTIVGQELEEDSLGALKIFGRTNRLLFDRSQAGLDAVSAGGQGLRLYLDGHDSRYFFQWLPQFVPQPAAEDAHQAARERARETRERLKLKAKQLGSHFH